MMACSPSSAESARNGGACSPGASCEMQCRVLRTQREDPRAPGDPLGPLVAALLGHEARLQAQLDDFMEKQKALLQHLKPSGAKPPCIDPQAGLGKRRILRKGSTIAARIVALHSDTSVGESSLCSPLRETDLSHATTPSPWWKGSRPPNRFLSDLAPKNMASPLILAKGWVFKTAERCASLNMQPLSKSAQAELMRQRTRLQQLISSAHFDGVCALMIIANAIALAVQIEYMATKDTRDPPHWHTYVQCFFTAWFCLELLMRIWALRLSFFVSSDWRWNVFDFAVVTISVVETGLSLARPSTQQSNQFGVARVLRILRLVRVVRIIRVVRFFSELRMMVYSSMRSLRPFFWALCLLLMLTCMFGMHVSQVVTEYRVGNPDEDTELLMDFYGSLHESIYTLFQAVSGGVSWRDVAAPLLQIHWSYAIWVSAFVSFVIFAVLNIVTGVFVGSAMQSAQEDQDVVIADQMNQEDSYANEVLRIFEEADKNHSGFLELWELEAHFKDHRVRAYLRHIGLDIDEAVGLFQLLDIGNTGRVDSKAFLLGCMRLKGPAKNVDVATLLHENKRMMALWSQFMQFTEEKFGQVISLLGQFEVEVNGCGEPEDIGTSPMEVERQMESPGPITL